MKHARTLATPAAAAKHIMGTGCSSSARMGEAAEKALAMKLQKPKEVAANIVGKIAAWAMYTTQKHIATPNLATSIRKKKV